LTPEDNGKQREGLVRAVRLASVAGLALIALGIGGCGPDHHRASATSGVALTGNKGEIKGILTEVGGPPGASPQPVDGTVDVYTLGGNHIADMSPVSAWDFELEPGTYMVQAAAVGGVPCPAIKVRVVKAVIQTVPLVCPIK
jgi:hypothetical protein